MGFEPETLKRLAALEILRSVALAAFTMLAAQNVEIELVIQTRGHAHVADVLEVLRSAGFDAQLV